MRFTTDEKQHAGDTAVDTTADKNSLNILLLDDEKAVLSALSRLLRALGHQCTTALTGEALLEILEQSLQKGIRYDLAILDIKIVGGMGGIETMHRIKQVDNSLPVMSMSGYPANTLFKGDESSGFVVHLEKPFNAGLLAAEIDRVCTTASLTSDA